MSPRPACCAANASGWSAPPPEPDVQIRCLAAYDTALGLDLGLDHTLIRDVDQTRWAGWRDGDPETATSGPAGAPDLSAKVAF